MVGGKDDTAAAEGKGVGGRGGGASTSTSSSSLSEQVKEMAWGTMVRHARHGDLCFVTARPTPPNYEGMTKKDVTTRKMVARERDILDALAMKLDNPSLRCVFSFLLYFSPLEKKLLANKAITHFVFFSGARRRWARSPSITHVSASSPLHAHAQNTKTGAARQRRLTTGARGW